MPKPVSVYFNTRPWTFSHTRAPRGFGSWAFAFSVGDAGTVFTRAMTFSDAKRWARTEARARAAAAPVLVNAVDVDVLP